MKNLDKQKLSHKQPKNAGHFVSLKCGIMSATTVNKAQISAPTLNKPHISATTVDKPQLSATTPNKPHISATTVDKPQINATPPNKPQISATTPK